MKKTIDRTFGLAMAMIALGLMACPASAFTYTNTHLLLIFHLDSSRNDVEFNLGSVSNYLNQPNGTTVTVANWDPSLVRSNYDGDLNGVLVSLLATTTIDDAVRRTWITVASSGAPTDMSGSAMSQLRSKIDGFGQQAAASTYYSANNSFVISPNEASSYTYMASDAYTTPVATLGGRSPGTTTSPLSPVTVEGSVPVSLAFYQLQVANFSPKPAARQVGTFSLTADGTLTYTSGTGGTPTPPPAPKITGISRQGSTATVFFNTTTNASYRLVHSTNLRSSVTNWTMVGTSATGNGGTMSLQDVASDPLRFYGVQATR
jgi:hypothetical protein